MLHGVSERVFLNLKKKCTELYLIHNIVLVLGIQESDLVIYIYTYIHTHTQVYLYIYICIYIYICTHIPVSVCLYYFLDTQQSDSYIYMTMCIYMYI